MPIATPVPNTTALLNPNTQYQYIIPCRNPVITDRSYTNRVSLSPELAIYGRQYINKQNIENILDVFGTYYEITQPAKMKEYLIAFLDENRTQDFFDIIAGINNGIKEIYEYYPSDVEPALFVSVDSENDSKKIFILIKTKQDAEQATNSLYKTLDRWLVDEQAFINSNLGIINEPITVSME